MSTSAFLLCFYLFPRAPRQAPRGLQDSLLQNIHWQLKIRPQLSHHNSWCSRDSIKGVQCMGQCFAWCRHDKVLRKGLNEKPRHSICTCQLIDWSQAWELPATISSLDPEHKEPSSYAGLFLLLLLFFIKWEIIILTSWGCCENEMSLILKKQHSARLK